jgi:hypothetical protein
MSSSHAEKALERLRQMSIEYCGFIHHQDGNVYSSICSNERQERMLCCAHSSRSCLFDAIAVLEKERVLNRTEAEKLRYYLQNNYLYDADSRAASAYEVLRCVGSSEEKSLKLKRLSFDVGIEELSVEKVRGAAANFQQKASRYLVLLRDWLIQKIEQVVQGKVVTNSADEVLSLIATMSSSLIEAYAG